MREVARHHLDLHYVDMLINNTDKALAINEHWLD